MRLGTAMKRLLSETPEIDRTARDQETTVAYWKKARSFAKDHLLIPCLVFVFGIVIADQVKDWWTGPKTYKIYFVGNLKNRDVKRVLLGVKQESDSAKLEVDGINVEFEREDDSGTEDGARAVATNLAKRDDTLIVIGHVLDQQTVEALPIYMTARPAVPVIATVETGSRFLANIPACIPKNAATDYCPFIQMSPSEEEEAIRAVDFAVHKGKKRFLIASEVGDPPTSKTSSLKDYYEKVLSDPSYVSSGVQPAVVIDVPKQGIADIARIKSEDPDCILYIGSLETALPLIDQVRRLPGWTSPPTFVLSEASLKRSALLDTFPPLADVYFASQEDGKEINLLSSVYGEDAYNIASALLQAANEQLRESPTWAFKIRHSINMHRAADVRNALKAAMLKGEQSDQEFPGVSDQVYRFSNHRRINSRFHMLQTSSAGLRDADCTALPCYK